MSAPPSSQPNGQNPNSSSNSSLNANADQPGRPRPPTIKKRPRSANPLVAPKRSQPKKNASRPGPSAGAASRTSSAARPAPSSTAHMTPEAQTTALLSRMIEYRSKTEANGGWSEPLPPGGREYKIVTTKRDIADGVRFHAMKFHASNIGRSNIDPTNQDDFTRPVTLQRRDPRQPAPGREVKLPEVPEPEPNPEDEKEAERIAKLKAEKEAWKAMEAAKSAPAIKDPNAGQKVKQSKQEERGVQFHRAPRSEHERKQQELRYEEALPWHIEDADGKNVWVGSYVAPMSETHACLVATQDGKFKMVPLEKWYKFIAKPNFTSMKLEDAEAAARQNGVSRWAAQDKEKQAKLKEMDETRQWFHGPARIKMESNTARGATQEDRFDGDQIDFEGDEFQDDDEAPNFEPDNDEEQKDATDRIRRDQLGANLFGDADEGKIDKEELERRLLEETRRKEGKKMTKALIKREKETIYQSDSESGYDPFDSSSSDSDSDEENKDKEKQGQEQGEENKEDDKPSSQEPSSQKQEGKGSKDKGPSSKSGTLTPSGRQKQVDATKKGKSLKRAGSPNLSESSGTESSRKKKQKKNVGTSVQASRSGTPLPPGAGGQKQSRAAGATSDGEATGGEMSDGARQHKKKIKLMGTGTRGTPTGSRAGSPAPATGGAVSPTSPSARAGSPTSAKPIDKSELLAVLPPLPQGISLGELLKHFSGRIGSGPGQTPKADWIALVKASTNYGQDKLMRRKE